MSRSTIAASLTAGVATAALVVLCAADPAFGGRKAPAPYRVAVEVAYGERVGSESMREWAEREIVRQMDEADCFAAVWGFRDGDPEQADLLLRVVMNDFEEKTEHEVTLAQREDPGAPPSERLRLIASLELWGELQLRTLPEGEPVRGRALHLERGYRPALGEDPAYEVRRLVIEGLGEEVRRWSCKGARKKLPAEIERARTRGGAAR